MSDARDPPKSVTDLLNLSCSDPKEKKRKKINLNFFFTLLCGAPNGPFEAPQKSVKIKMYDNLHFNMSF